MRSADSTDRSPELQTLRAASTEGLRPVTIRQLVNATRDHSDAPFHIDDIEVRDVVVVAQVLRIRRFDTITMFDLEDGTTGGSIIAKRWRNGRDDSELPTTLDEQLYARIVGRLARGKEAKNALEVKTLRVITDPHELLFHILEVAFVHLCFERGPPPVSVRETIEPRGATGVHYEPLAGLPATAPNTPAIPRTRAANVRPTPNPDRSDASASRTSVTPRPETPPPRPPPDSPSPPTSPSPAPTRRVQAPAIPSPSGSRRVSALRPDPYAHLTVLERAILLQILNVQNTSRAEEGVHVRTIVRGVSHHNVTQAEISEAIDGLAEKGFIAHVDEEHYTMATNHYPRSSQA